MRPWKSVVLLFLAAAPLGCSAGLPAFQTVPLEPSSGSGPLKGTWYDYAGNPSAVVTASHLRIRLWPDLRLVAARAEPRRIVLTCTTRDGTRLLLGFQMFRRDTAVLVVDGRGPSNCGTCTPYFVRNLPAGYLLRQRLDRAKHAVSTVHDRAMDTLIDAF